MQTVQNNISIQKAQRQIAGWLLLGAGMIVIQVMLGGITRLTESGLSITEWKPITGMLPPIGDAAWQAEFDKYKNTDQFKYVHQHFSLSDFKFIFFWEWFHRVWARLMGIVFLVGFVYFIATKKFQKNMVGPMVVLFLLGALQGAIGWIMVKSGLVPEKYFVGHIELTTHFIAALGLLCYVLWFALQLTIKPQQQLQLPNLRKLLWVITAATVTQLVFGGFMAGIKAGITAPTWPDINGSFLPPAASDLQPAIKNIFYNPLAIQFIHRALAYLLLGLSLIWLWRSAKIQGYSFFSRLRISFSSLVFLQVLLGIITVLNATYPGRLLWLGVSHQFVAMLLLGNLTALLFTVRGSRA